MLDQYRSLIDELLETPAAVRTVLDQADEDSLAEALGLVAALHERDKFVMERIQRMLNQSSAHLKILPDVDDAVDLASIPDDRDTLLTAFETTRGELVSKLMNLTLSDWAKRATHDAGGEVELADEIEDHVDFDEDVRERLDSLS